MRSSRLALGVAAIVAALLFGTIALGPLTMVGADSPGPTATAGENITVSINDSTNGNATETVPITVTNGSSIPADAVYESGSTAAAYDTDGDGQISIGELGSAGGGYATGEISIGELGGVGAAFANSG